MHGRGGQSVSGHCRQEVQGAGSSALSSSVSGADFTNTFYLLSSFPVEPGSQGLADFLTALTAQCASLEELRLAFRPQMDPRWVLGCCFHGVCFRKGTFRTEHMGGRALRECWTVSWAPGGPHGRSTPKTGGPVPSPWQRPTAQRTAILPLVWGGQMAQARSPQSALGQLPRPALGPAQEEPVALRFLPGCAFCTIAQWEKHVPRVQPTFKMRPETCFNKRANRLGPRGI